MVKLTLRKHLTALVLIGGVTGPSLAQSLFDPVISVDRSAITQYELEQRIQFLRILERSTDVDERARESLIDDHLKMAAASRVGIALSEDTLTQAMSAFAANANLSLGQLLINLAQDGVDEETYRDYIEVGTTWREVVRSRFASRGNPTEEEIDRALASAGDQGGIQVLLTEIVLPAAPEQLANARQTAERLTRIKSASQFSEQARLLSASQSRNNGGKLEWTNLNDLPAGLRPIISGLYPGQITEPLEVQNAIVLFQLRDVAESSATGAKISAIEYALLSGPAEAVATASRKADTCDDFFGLAKAEPGLELTIQSQTPDQISRSIALRITSLDKNEFIILPAAQTGQTDLVMLCARVHMALENVSRAQIAGNLRTARLTSLADGYLAELRSTADIIFH